MRQHRKGEAGGPSLLSGLRFQAVVQEQETQEGPGRHPEATGQRWSPGGARWLEFRGQSTREELDRERQRELQAPTEVALEYSIKD